MFQTLVGFPSKSIGRRIWIKSWWCDQRCDLIIGCHLKHILAMELSKESKPGRFHTAGPWIRYSVTNRRNDETMIHQDNVDY